MQQEVIVALSEHQEFQLIPNTTMDSIEARQWLDAQFVALDCEPLRASGKVLLADKVLVIAATAGAKLLSDGQWGPAFAAASLAALAKPLVRIDVPAQTVGF